MNKKTKSFAVGLVAVLCFLLVFAIGFGVTGAWCQAQRRASGTVKMDQGIYLKFTGLKTLDANENKDLSDKLGGKLLLSDGVTELTNVSVVPSQLVEITVPTVTAAKGSVAFYARVKVTYTAKYVVEDPETHVKGLSDTAVPVQPATMTQLFGAAGQLQPGEGWVANADGYWYYAATGETTKLVAMTPNAAADGTDHPLFATGNLQFADWTAANSTAEPEDLVEAGGPLQDGKEIGQVIVTVDIEVIQAANNTAPTGWAYTGDYVA